MNDDAWMRIRSDGTTITAYVATSEAGLDTASPCYTSSNFVLDGGQIGFRAFVYYIDKLTVKTDRDANGTYETIEHFDDFETDSNHHALETPTYDKAGNLTWDGNQRYAYDAWNRQIEVRKGFRDSGGTLQSGSVFATMRYDGRGRRIVKAIQNMADLDGTFHYYYDGDRTIEQRNGSDQVLKQYVWGMQYIDELVQIAINQDPQNATSGTYTENLCERFYWTVADANFNIVGVVAPNGRMIERYEYTPYGQRVVFSHGRILGDLNDDGIVDSTDTAIYTTESSSPTAQSIADINGDGQVNSSDQALLTAALGQTWPSNDPQVSYRVGHSFRGGYAGNITGAPLCEVGHQGLLHDDEFGLIYNRARTLHPVLGRFMQRDPLGYVDGMNLYQYVRGNPIGWMDPSGYQSQQANVISGEPAKMISYVDEIDFAGLSDGEMIALYEALTGNTITPGRHSLSFAAISLMLPTVNPTPPSTFNSETWANFLDSKEYRGWLQIEPSICCYGGIATHAGAVVNSSQGYTPGRASDSGRTWRYDPGEGSGGWTMWYANPEKSCVYFSAWNRFRVGDIGQIISKIGTGAGVPYAWEQINYKLCCDGSSDVTFEGSQFPSHVGYFRSDVTYLNQRNLPAFIHAGDGNDAP